MVGSLVQLCNEVTVPWWLWLLGIVAVGRLGSRMERTLAHAGRRRETLWDRHENFWWRSALSRAGWCIAVSAAAGGFGLFAWMVAAVVVALLRMPMEAQPAVYVIPLATVVPAILLLSSVTGLADRLRSRVTPAPRQCGNRLKLRWAQLQDPEDEHDGTIRTATEIASLVLGRAAGLGVLSWNAPGGGQNAALVEAVWTWDAPKEMPVQCELPKRAIAVSRELLDTLSAESIASVIVFLVKASDTGAQVDRAGADQATVLAMHDPAPLLSALEAVGRNPGPCAEGIAQLGVEASADRGRCQVGPEWLAVRVVWFTETTSRVQLLDRMDTLRRATHGTT